jgi:hypothetical protein
MPWHRVVDDYCSAIVSPFIYCIYMFMSPDVYVSFSDCFHISFLYIETLISFLTSSFYVCDSLPSLPLSSENSFRNYNCAETLLEIQNSKQNFDFDTETGGYAEAQFC